MRQRRTWVIVLIWVAVLFAMGEALEQWTDGDPSTDDDVAYGFLGVIVGGFLTALYLGVTKPRPKAPPSPLRACPSCGAKMACDTGVCPTCGAESQPWVRHHDTWWFRSPSGWQWVDEAGTWRWYRDGTPSSGATTDMTPNLAIDPAHVEPPSASDAHSPPASSIVGAMSLSTKIRDNPWSLLLAAATCALVTISALVLWAISEATAFFVLATAGIDIGLGWALPGFLIGRATALWAKKADQKHPTALGVSAGIGSAIAIRICIHLVMQLAGIDWADMPDEASVKRG